MVEKCQKKLFQILLLGVVLRNTIDIYKLMTLLCMLFLWVIHWLASKRTKGLIGEENRSWSNHAKLLVLFACLVLIDGLCTGIFAVQYFRYGRKISDIYIMIGFEVSQLTHNLISAPVCCSKPSKTTSNTRFLSLRYITENSGSRKSSCST